MKKPKKIRDNQRRVETIFETRKPTTEDWHPTFEDGCVEIRQYEYFNFIDVRCPRNRYKTVVRGEDDTVMSLYQDLPEEAEKTRNWLYNLAYVCYIDLKDFGFEFE